MTLETPHLRLPITTLLEQQQAMSRAASTMLPALEGIEQMMSATTELRSATSALTRFVDSMTLQPPTLPRFNELAALETTMRQAAQQLRPPTVRIPLDSILAAQRSISQLAAVPTLGRIPRLGVVPDLSGIMSQPSFQSLVDRIVDSLKAVESEETVSVEQLARVTTAELAASESASVSRIDPFTFLAILLALVFGLIEIHSDVATANRLESIDTKITSQSSRLESVERLLDELVACSLASRCLDRPIEASHQLSRNLHLRLLPSASATSLGVVQRGRQVQVLGFTEGWARVALISGDADNAMIGWMYGRYLREIPLVRKPSNKR